MAVVAADLRVHGLKNLRVVDASVFPTIPNGNLNAPTMMLAERGADLIKGRAGTATTAVLVYLDEQWQDRQKERSPKRAS